MLSTSRRSSRKRWAENCRAERLQPVRKGEQFETESGLPASEFRELNSPTWYAHACAYALMKWPSVAAKHRASIAEALTTITSALVEDRRGAPQPATLRTALNAWAFQATRNADGILIARMDADEPPPEIARALAWIADRSLKVADLGESEKLRCALDAISVRLDGTKAADSTIRRKRMVLSNALRYAVERDLLTVNPLSRIDWEPPPTDDEMSFQYVPDPKQAQTLLQAVREQGQRGEHLYAFFGCRYYAALRPSELAALTNRNCKLPETGWGELVLTGSRPEVAGGWTDDGRPYEERGLKRRARKATCTVPYGPRAGRDAQGASRPARDRRGRATVSGRARWADRVHGVRAVVGGWRGRRRCQPRTWRRPWPRCPTRFGMPVSHCGSTRAWTRWKWRGGPVTVSLSCGASTPSCCAVSSIR